MGVVKNKRVLAIGVFIIGLIFILIGGVLNYLGNPKRIMAISIDNLNKSMNRLLNNENKLLQDSYTMTSNIKFNLESDYLKSLATQDPAYLPFYQLLTNLNNTNSNITLTQDKTNKKLLLNYNSNLNNIELITGKYLIENNTEYYYVNGITPSYINNGNNNYFETLNSETTQQENLLYIVNRVSESLKENLTDDYFTKTKENNLTKIGLKLDNESMNKLINSILKDLKKDKKATEILTGYNKDFKNLKIKNNTILEKGQKLEINIYTDSIVYTPKKYELIFLDNRNTNKLVYEKNDKKGLIMIYNNNKLESTLELTTEKEQTTINALDSKNKKIGTLTLNNTKNSKKISMNLNIDNMAIDLSISSKNTNIKKEKSYNNDTKISIVATTNNTSLLDFNISITSSIITNIKIEENVSDSILKSSITTEQQENLNNKLTNIISTLTNG